MEGRIPILALVGRPNVGKSTVFNRLTKTRRALVFDRPGVTRDRIFGEVRVDGRLFRIVDTGGLDSDPDDPLLDRMRLQTQIGVDEADAILLVVDARAGVQPADQEVMRWLRKSGKPVAVVANKVDGAKQEGLVDEFYELGPDTLCAASAEHGLGMEEVLDWALQVLDAPLEEEVERARGPIPVADEEPAPGEVSKIEWEAGRPIRVAVVGRPNVGKSSLINALLGEERLLATDVAGTTRDAIDVSVTRDGQPFVFVDTAGMRKKKQVRDKVEQFSVMMARRSVDDADVVVLVLDVTQPVSEQDARIVSMAHRAGKGIVLILNKWDIAENRDRRKEYQEAVFEQLAFVSYARVLFTSATRGKGIDAVYAEVVSAERERHRRVATSELNRFFGAVVESRPPPAKDGKRPHLYYVTQPHVRPPTFVFVARNADSVDDAYARFLRNQLRKYFGFEGSPIWLKFRPRDKGKKGKVLDQ